METKSNYSTPIAIVLAGIIIAGTLYFSDGKGTVSPKTSIKKEPSGLSQIRPITEESHIFGNPNAPAIVIEYSDTECPFCQRFQATMQEVMNSYGKEGKVAWVYRHFPLDSLHSKARKEAEATECVNELGGNTAFWQMLDTIYARTPTNNGLDLNKLPEFAVEAGVKADEFNVCLASGKYASQVEADYQDGLKAGATGTPYSVIALRQALNSSQKSALDAYVVKTQLFDRSGAPIVFASPEGDKVVMGGALTTAMIKSIIDIIIN